MGYMKKGLKYSQKWNPCPHVVPNLHDFLLLEHRMLKNAANKGSKQHWTQLTFILWPKNKQKHHTIFFWRFKERIQLNRFGILWRVSKWQNFQFSSESPFKPTSNSWRTSGKVYLNGLAAKGEKAEGKPWLIHDSPARTPNAETQSLIFLWWNTLKHLTRL